MNKLLEALSTASDKFGTFMDGLACLAKGFFFTGLLLMGIYLLVTALPGFVVFIIILLLILG